MEPKFTLTEEEEKELKEAIEILRKVFQNYQEKELEKLN